jgi:hypothetical protein
MSDVVMDVCDVMMDLLVQLTSIVIVNAILCCALFAANFLQFLHKKG